MEDFSAWRLDAVNPVVYQLSEAPPEAGAGELLLARWARKWKGGREVPTKPAQDLDYVGRVGVAGSLKIGKVRHLRGDLYEIKAGGAAVRLFSRHEHGSGLIVVLGVEKTHGGKLKDNYSKAFGRYERLADIAGRKLSEYGIGEDTC